MDTEKLTDSEHNWLRKQNFDPDTARWLFWARNFIARRTGFELPPGVTEDRRKVDLLRMAEQIDRIEKHTEDVPWLTQFLANASKFLGGEAAKKYPPRRK